jgi:predicted transcriptional regulator
MIICRNINSKKSFVIIKEIGWDMIQAITPLNQIKIVNRHLFEDEIEADEADFLNSGVITEKQFKIYQDYKRNRDRELLGFNVYQNRPGKSLPNNQENKAAGIQPNKKRWRNVMKTIEIDEEVYAYLQKEAFPFEEPTPNHVIRRIIGLDKKVPDPLKPKSEGGSKAPKANLVKLVEQGFLKDGQKLYLNYKGQNLSMKYEATISGNKFIYDSNLYTMSRLVAEILEQEGCGIQSKSYRGPEYWVTSEGVSIRQMWEQFQRIR